VSGIIANRIIANQQQLIYIEFTGKGKENIKNITPYNTIKEFSKKWEKRTKS